MKNELILSFTSNFLNSFRNGWAHRGRPARVAYQLDELFAEQIDQPPFRAIAPDDDAEQPRPRAGTQRDALERQRVGRRHAGQRHDRDAQTVEHHGRDRLEGVELHRFADLDATLLQPFVDQPADPGLAIEADERVRGEQRLGRRGERLTQVSLRRPGTDFWDRLLRPGEPGFSADWPVEAVDVLYPRRSTPFFGFDIPWWGTFFIVSIAAALLMKPFVKVQF